ncbi:hypothetical protein K438DRAFT_1979693 [Mycena galopus ATCC 62051]|nr:hypothetical protein K438DRAFT_1979693 [Mycena galopus ATCC 62051]
MSVLVDDNDPLVQSPEFDNTTHTSATPGDTAVLEFKGTSIRVYGTIGPNTGQSRLNFSIDGGDLESYQAPSVPAAQTHGNPNQLLWASPILNETSHHLVITVDNDSSLLPHPNSTTGTFFLDYFVYNTTAAVEQPLFDDSDASVIYSPGGWQSGNSTDCLESTQHVSASAESWAALSFNGTGISLVGTPSQPGFKASIVIDGSQPIISQFQDQNQQLFNTSGLTSGPHTINVTVLEGNLAIDYFMVTNDGPASSNPPTKRPPHPREVHIPREVQKARARECKL